MRKLLSANLRRLWMNQGFWLTVLLMICAEAGLCWMLSQQGAIPLDSILFLSLQGIGVLISVFFSLFLGTEYSDGTMRNKIIVGHKRSRIYLASFTMGVLAITVIYLAGLATGVIMGMLMFAPPQYSIGQIVLAGTIGWLACVTYIAIYTLIGTLSASKARTSIISILVAFTLVFSGLIIYAFLQMSPSATLMFLFEINPLGQTVQAMSIAIASPLRLVSYSLLLSIAMTGLGLYAFCKKDLK